MRNFFKARSPSILAMDLSASSITVLEVSVANRVLYLEGYERESLPPNIINNDINALTQGIKNLYSRSRLSCKKVILAVPDSAVISKIVQINAGLNDEEIEELVILEADKYIPHPIDEINLDFEILGPSLHNSAMLDVLMVATRTEHITSRVEAVSRAGLEVLIVDVESYAIARAALQQIKELSLDEKEKIIAILNIASQSIHLLVLRGSTLIFSREEKFAAIQSDPLSSERVSLRQELLLIQIKRTLQFFYSINHQAVLDHLLLASDLRQQTSLALLIEEQLGIPTSIANPLSNFSFSEGINEEWVNKQASSLMIACGLALRVAE